MSLSTWIIVFLILGNTISRIACSLQLVKGQNACSGRVEVLYNGQWGTVCDNGWDLSDAAVVCREMGCGSVIEAKTGSYFGQGSGSIWMTDVKCVGNESTLSSCQSNKWSMYGCDHSKDAGVICQLTSIFRLVDGREICSGRVEVLYNETWGTVCHDNWDWLDANVVCRELDCGDIKETKAGAFFGQGTGPVWLSDLQCTNHEYSLRNCKSSGWGQNSCEHNMDAGVVCKGKTKLVNGNDACSGRVEIFQQWQWGTVCDDGWDESDAAVVCREMGCGSVIEAKTGSYFGQGSGSIWMTDVNCVGDESTLSSCQSRKWEKTDCDHSKEAGVICQPLIRLVNGLNSCSGRVEVFHDGEWGTVCDDSWDWNDATVACREMDCGGVKETMGGAFFGQGTGRVWLNNSECYNTESTLRNCQSSGWLQNTIGHEKVAGVVCHSRTRLVDGFSSCSGRVEVLRNGVWGTVCDDGWDVLDAAVVCREMGCGSVIEAKTGAYFGKGPGSIWTTDVKCVGDESTLRSCESRKWGVADCDRSKNAGVICQSHIRLVNGSHSCSGRVEVLHDGQWGTVCDNDWNNLDAAVACREMGCGKFIEAKTGAYFGQGTGQVWLSDLQCYNSEFTLKSCKSSGWGKSSCGHEKDAGVACQPKTKLVDGFNACSGRVEVFQQWYWGKVCDDGWDVSDAAVVCREMGCGDVIEAKTGAYFGQGSGSIWMADVNCVGNESTLSACESRKWGVTDCHQSKEAGVICQPLIRLVNGSNTCSGRVEVFYDGQWGTVCDDGWDLSDANIVCREMGCGDVIDKKTGAYFGQGSGPVWMRDLQCDKTEYTLRNCKSSGWRQNSCGHEKDAGVVCQPKTKLVNGINSCSGRVEVLNDGQWGTVCGDGWDVSDAAVVCREMGCGDVIAAKTGAYFEQGSGSIWMTDINCVGNESSLSSCESRKWGVTDCDHSKDAGVICQSLIRLDNGIHSCSGRVEVRYNGKWGTVCDDGWDLADAAVVCREMGCGDVIEAKTGAYFGQGSGPVWMSDLQCSNNESTLSYCQSSGWGTGSCGHEKDAGVICGLRVRLVSGSDSCSGRVEVQHDGQWGTVCDYGWDLSEAAVVCREIGCGRALEAKTGAYFGQGLGSVWMTDVKCVGNESFLTSCPFNSSSLGCGHEKDAGVICGYVHVRLRIKVKVAPGVDLNNSTIKYKLLKEIGRKVSTNQQIFPLKWKTQSNGMVFQKIH
ncbi:deleted in malignant brain tumors 1 protein-like [Xyrauchen texanus]|uniref:deleted in malignant brain tumors 1 protein-like n=1 Tax=Xyrauchen texanus TaxID=154827 RepID=UPI002242ACBF|nr:deleted in malignant brain tumors 1 protein-like [Xyrauchen texanus]